MWGNTPPIVSVLRRLHPLERHRCLCVVHRFQHEHRVLMCISGHRFDGTPRIPVSTVITRNHLQLLSVQTRRKKKIGVSPEVKDNRYTQPRRNNNMKTYNVLPRIKYIGCGKHKGLLRRPYLRRLDRELHPLANPLHPVRKTPLGIL